MGKPGGHPMKNVTINKSSGSGSQSSQLPDDMCDLSLNLAGNYLAAQENKDSAKKGKSIKIEEVTGTAYKNTCRIKVEPSFMKPSSSHDQPAPSRLSLGGNNTRIESGRSSGLRFRQDPAARGNYAPESSSARGSVLIVMGCRNCYMHVMVCDADRRCPVCGRGDGLLDMYRD